MKCRKCNAKIKENDLFCPECGKKTKENIFNKFLKFIYNYRTIICLSIILISLLIFIFNTIMYIFSPQYISKKYISAIANNKYNEIYKLLDLKDDKLINKKILKNKIDKINIDAYKIDEVNLYDDKALVTYKYEDNNEIKYVSVLLRNSLEKKYLFFDNWKILSPKVATNVIIKVPKNSKVLLDNIDIKSYKEKTNDYDIYNISKMISGNYKINIELENGIKVEDEIDIISNKTYSIGNINLDDNTKNDLKEQLLFNLNTFYNGLINKLEYKDTGLNILKNEYKGLKNSLIYNSYNLNSFNFTDFDIIYITYDKFLEVTFTLNSEYSISNNDQYYNGFKSNEIKAYYNYIDNKYYLDSISNLPFIF